MSGGPLERRLQRGCWLVALLALLPWLPALVTGELLAWDDDYLVSRNEAGLLRAPLLAVLDPRGDRTAFGSEFLPLRDLSYRLDARLWGITGPGAAFGFRLSNLLLYGLCCGLGARLLLELGRLAGWPAGAALWGALLFAWHPAHAESVAWVAGRKDVLSGALVFAALLAWLRARQRGGAWLALTPALGALACLAKGTAVALPLLALACELLDRSRRPWRRRLRDLLPLLAVCAGLALLHAWVGGQSGVRQPPRPLEVVLLADLPVLRRYLVTALVPLRLAIDHGDLVQALRLRPDALAWPSPLLVQAGLSLLALGPLACAALRARAAWPRWALAWSLGGLVPVLNLVPIPHWVADRFLFLPLLAPCLALGLLPGRAGRARLAVGLLLLVPWGGLALRRGLDFASDEALWRAELRQDPEDPLALQQLGLALLRRGAGEPDPARRAALEAEGRGALERSLDGFARLLVPSGHEPEAWLQLALARAGAGALEPALTLVEQAAARFPADARPPLIEAGLLRQAGRRDEARRALQAARVRLEADRGPPGPRGALLRLWQAEAAALRED